jgi:hypothetical protein
LTDALFSYKLEIYKPILMKLLATLALIGMTATPALAGPHGHRSVHYEEYCYKNVERYVPGYYNKHGQWVGGYVDSERKRVPCGYRHSQHHHAPQKQHQTDDNSCIEGSILGGILGGGAGAAASRGDGRLWAIPLGIVGGALVGCQVDGG